MYTTTEQLFQLLNKLPNWYKDMLLSIHSDDMAISTKCGYCRDVIDYFKFLKKVNPEFKQKSIKEFELDDLEKITPSDANEYATYLQQYSAHTISRKLASVSSMYIELMRFNRVSTNPFSIVRRPKIKKNVITYLTEEEMKQLFQTIESGLGLSQRELGYHNPVRDKALYSLFLDTGMRISEVVGSNIKDFDFNECSVIVTRKGGKHEMIFYSDMTRDRLMEYLEYRKMATTADPLPFFINSRGTRLSVNSIQKLTEKYAQIAIPNKHISPHKLRSTFAMNFYGKTHDLLLLQKRMGHSNISTTTVYSEAVQESIRNSRNILMNSDN